MVASITTATGAAAVTRRPVFSKPSHRVDVVTGAVVLFLDARQQEHLVVHRESEGDAEHEDRCGDVECSGGGEVEQSTAVALLEDPHRGAEGRAEAVRAALHGLIELQRCKGDFPWPDDDAVLATIGELFS
jgi:hypothetical protein